MSYPDPRYRRTRGELSAVYRTVDAGSQLTVRLKTEVHYLAAGAGTNGEFGLYRRDMAGPPAGPTPHFHRTGGGSTRYPVISCSSPRAASTRSGMSPPSPHRC